MIPPILLEGDHPSPTLLEGPGQRFALTPNPAARPSIRDPAQLPEGYGTKRLFLTARDPEWLYAHWDMTHEQQRECNQRSIDGHLVLRVYPERVEGAPLAEVHVHPESRHWFLHVGQGGAEFAAELGYYATGEVWTRVATSEPARTPEGKASVDESVVFATVPTETPLPRLMAQIRHAGLAQMPLAQAIETLRAAGQEGFPPIPMPPPTSLTPEQAVALAQITGSPPQVPEVSSSVSIGARAQGGQGRPLDQPTSPVGAVSSPMQSLGGGGLAVPADFWFKVNAELVIYGATEANANVRIGGRPIALRPDGTFSFRFALPDGQYELPVVAINAANTDGRAVDLNFSRETTCCGAVAQHPQDPALKPPSPESI